jgi:alkylated DNA repair dioxygenase AlkB
MRAAAQKSVAAETVDLFGERASAPAGFRYQPDLVSAEDEQALVRRFQALPFKPFEFHGNLGNRRIISYGYRYDYGGQILQSSDPVPEWLYPLRTIAGRFSGALEADMRQALVTEYAPGAGIGWHRDKPMFEKVVALSFLAPCDLRLRRRVGKGWERHTVPIAPRSAYLLSGCVREEWEHSIVPMDELRYSVTFRSFRPGDE